MSVDLSKCKVGDKVQLRNGKVVKLFENKNGDNKKFPWYHNGGVPNGFVGVDNEGFCCIYWKEQDIVKVLTRHNDRKVAKCVISNGYDPVFTINSFGITSWRYTTRKNAIRGAQRFCKRIGYECEIVK